MKTLSQIFACLVATLAIAALAQADEEKHLKLILQTSPEAGLVTIETEDLALGESRSFTSEKGHPVLLTRTEKGFELEVDGNKTQIDLPAPGGEGFEFETRDEKTAGEGGEQRIERHVIVKRLGSGAAVQMNGDESGARIEIQGDPASAAGKEVRIIHLGGGAAATAGDDAKKIEILMHGEGDFPAARAKLIASGALDGLDEATRQKILAALGGQQ